VEYFSSPDKTSLFWEKMNFKRTALKQKKKKKKKNCRERDLVFLFVFAGLKKVQSLSCSQTSGTKWTNAILCLSFFLSSNTAPARAEKKKAREGERTGGKGVEINYSNKSLGWSLPPRRMRRQPLPFL
jgi:hypothetical protein